MTDSECCSDWCLKEEETDQAGSCADEIDYSIESGENDALSRKRGHKAKDDHEGYHESTEGDGDKDDDNGYDVPNTPLKEDGGYKDAEKEDENGVNVDLLGQPAKQDGQGKKVKKQESDSKQEKQGCKGKGVKESKADGKQPAKSSNSKRKKYLPKNFKYHNARILVNDPHKGKANEEVDGSGYQEG